MGKPRPSYHLRFKALDPTFHNVDKQAYATGYAIQCRFGIFAQMRLLTITNFSSLFVYVEAVDSAG